MAPEMAMAPRVRMISLIFGRMCLNRITTGWTPMVFSILINGSSFSCMTLERRILAVPVQAVTLIAMIELHFPGFR